MLLNSSTISARSASAILSSASKLFKRYADCPYIFSISANAEEQDLSKLFLGFTIPAHSRASAIGCLSTPLPTETNRRQPAISCSLAFFHPDRCHIFRSEIPGQPTPQVGRWNINRVADTGRDPSLQFAGDKFQTRWSTHTNSPPLPAALQALKPEEVTEILYLSDPSPEGLTESLGLFSNASELGLVSASTPFVTGRPVTLFRRKGDTVDVFDRGAVGIALVGPVTDAAQVQVQHSDLNPISEPMVLTSCEGNMVNSLDDANPAQRLLDEIERRGLSSKLGSDFKSDTFLLGCIQSGTVEQVFEITAGDPSRGNLSLKTDCTLEPGSLVQFFHKPWSDSVVVSQQGATAHNTIEFITSSDTWSENGHGLVEGASDKIPGRSVILSENGFILRKANKGGWRCTVPGSLAALAWPSLST